MLNITPKIYLSSKIIIIIIFYVVTGRLKRGTRGDEDDQLTAEEENLRDKWLHPDQRDLIPGAEASFLHPGPFVGGAGGAGGDAYEFMRTVIPVLRKSKQTLFGKNGLDSITLWRTTRSADGKFVCFLFFVLII